MIEGKYSDAVRENRRIQNAKRMAKIFGSEAVTMLGDDEREIRNQDATKELERLLRLYHPERENGYAPPAVEEVAPEPEPEPLPPIEDAALQQADALEARNPTIRKIQDVLCQQYGIKRNELLSARRSNTLVRPRQIGFWLCRELTARSFPEIGRRFGGRDHTTVLYAVDKIKKQFDDYREEIETLREALQ